MENPGTKLSLHMALLKNTFNLISKRIDEKIVMYIEGAIVSSKTHFAKWQVLLPEGDLHCQCILSISPAGMLQF